MIRRLFWLMLGFGAGVGTSVAAWRRVRRQRDRFRPGRVAERMGKSVSGVGDTLTSAVAEGRQAMQEREAELRRSDPRLG